MNLLKVEFEKKSEDCNHSTKVLHIPLNISNHPVSKDSANLEKPSLKQESKAKPVIDSSQSKKEKIVSTMATKTPPEILQSVKGKGAAIQVKGEVTLSSDNQAADNVVKKDTTLSKKEEQMLKRFSLDNQDQDVVGVTLPRICGVVQAFYLCCSCQASNL